MSSQSGAQLGARGVQLPRLSHVPTFPQTSGDDAIELAEMAGLFLDDWQQYVLRNSLGERPDGKWAAPSVGLIVPRQNGKGSILAARELAGLFLIGERKIIHSAHEQATASDQFRRLLELIEGVPEFERRMLKPLRGKGAETIRLRTGEEIVFKTRTAGGGRGMSCDCLILDEAMILPEEFVSAVGYTLAARSLTTPTGVQTWYVGSAVDQQTHQHGIVFARVREMGLRRDDGIAFFEWSVAAEDPGRVPRELLEDERAWAQANPGLGIRIAHEHVYRELHGPGGPRGFAVERLSIGDWPDTSDESSRVITVEAWNKLADRESSFSGPGVIALDVAPDSSSASIAGAGRRADGKKHVGIIDHDAGTRWVAQRLGELKKQLRPTAIVADASGAVAPLIPDIERAGVTLILTSAKEFAQACGMLANAAKDDMLRHPGTPELLVAIADSKTKPLADAWKWDRRSGADITPLVAVSLALWGVETQSPSKSRVINLNSI